VLYDAGAKNERGCIMTRSVKRDAWSGGDAILSPTICVKGGM
jgi:hypothetical protein